MASEACELPRVHRSASGPTPRLAPLLLPVLAPADGIGLVWVCDDTALGAARVQTAGAELAHHDAHLGRWLLAPRPLGLTWHYFVTPWAHKM